MLDKFIGFKGQSITQLSNIQLNVLPFISEVFAGLVFLFFFFSSIFFCFGHYKIHRSWTSEYLTWLSAALYSGSNSSR